MSLISNTGSLQNLLEVAKSLPDARPAPTGTRQITENGTYDVADFAAAKVDVPIPEGYIQPSGAKNISSNGTHDVAQYAEANVNVKPLLQEKTVTPTTSQQSVTPDANYEGLSKVTVNGVTSAIDTNIKAENIKKDISILGITGTLETGGGSNEWEAIYKDFIEQGSSRTSAVIPAGITAIGDYAFYNSTNLVTVDIPDGVIKLGDYAFSGCTKLAITELPESVTYITTSCFYKCTNLALTKLPDGLITLSSSSLRDCPNITIKEIPAGVYYLNYFTFGNCTGLTSVTIKNSKPTAVATTLFNGCTNLTEIKVPWAEGEYSGAPWGAVNATVIYNYTGA